MRGRSIQTHWREKETRSVSGDTRKEVGKGGTNQMIPHFGEASSAGTEARIASTACPNCAGRVEMSMLPLILSRIR